MNRRAKVEIPYYFAPGKKLFQVIGKVPAGTGALGKVLNLLEDNLKLVGTSTYPGPDGSCVLSAMAEAKSDKQTAAKLIDLVKSGGGLEVEVFEGNEGMLIDTYHTGLAAGTEFLMLLHRNTLNHMLDKVQRLLGSGGEVLLYEQGVAIGRARAEAVMKGLGVEKVRRNLGYLMNSLTAQGWGSLSVQQGKGSESVLSFHDCFECSSTAKERHGCFLIKGFLVGNFSVISGQELVAEETKCRLKGDELCEFRVTPRDNMSPARAGISR